jgi:hypothetical protein
MSSCPHAQPVLGAAAVLGVVSMIAGLLAVTLVEAFGGLLAALV